MRIEGGANGFVSQLLCRREGAGGTRNAVEEEGLRLHVALHERQHATVNEGRKQGGRCAARGQQFLAGNLLPTVGREGLGGVEKVEQQSLLTGRASERVKERPQTLLVGVIGSEADKRLTRRGDASLHFRVHMHSALGHQRRERREQVPHPRPTL